ncbi:hypothetical protein D3C75_1030040 [compost metagenome]
MNGHRQFARQTGGDLVDAAGKAFTGTVDQLFAHRGRQGRVTVRAQAREVAEQRVREHQETKAHIGFLTEMPRLHEHVRQRGGQRRIGVVGVAAGQAVGEVVALAVGILLHDLAQVDAVAAQGRGQQFVQAPALPVGQEQ